MQLFCGDSLVILKSIPDQSVDLIVTDPPYYKVLSQGWDNQWKSEQDFLAWCNEVLIEFKRVLKPNGSLYWFASPYMAAKLELLINQQFKVLNHIVWVKESGRHKACCKETLTKFFPQTERIIFAEQGNSNEQYKRHCTELQRELFAPIVDYFNALRKKAGLTVKQCVQICGKSTASHYFQHSQFHFPSKAHFDLLMTAFCENSESVKIRQEYEKTREQYHQLKQQYQNAKRAFSVTADVPYTDVWTFDVVQYYKNKHPCQKPFDLIKHIVKTSSRPNFTVLDAFMGSGSTGMVCLELGLYFIGIELEHGSFHQARQTLIDKWTE